MTKRPASIGAGKSASEVEALQTDRPVTTSNDFDTALQFRLHEQSNVEYRGGQDHKGIPPGSSRAEATDSRTLERQSKKALAMAQLGKGWVSGFMRSGRYTYRKVLVHTTNPDHLVPSPVHHLGRPRLSIVSHTLREGLDGNPRSIYRSVQMPQEVVVAVSHEAFPRWA